MRQIAHFFVAGVVLQVTMLVSSPAVAQNPLSNTSIPPAYEGLGRNVEDDPRDREFMRKQAKALNQKRQADLKRDAERLLQLATELKAQAVSGEDATPPISFHEKAREIEKLARSVKQKMQGPN